MAKKVEIKTKTVINKVSKPVKEKVNEIEFPTEYVEDIGDEEEIVKPKEVTIFDKYRKHINTSKEGYLKGFDYESAMEILRYLQSKTGHKYGLNMSCGSCLIELVKMFSRQEIK